MIMKTLILLIGLVLAVNYGFAQLPPDQHEWTATVKVVDEEGLPVAMADVKVGYFTNNTPVEIEGTTDTNGIFVASHTTSTINYVEYKLTVIGEKERFYSAHATCDLGIPYDAARWNPTIALILKKYGRPIGMYAKSSPMGLKPPEYKKKIGYDLMIGDWVGPYGKGVSSDIYFEKDYSNISSNSIIYSP
jgi:hypothetical protein